MQLKLVMPFIDKRIQRGMIVKWHKDEGEWVCHGDDLFEMRIEEMQVLIRPTLPKKIVQSLNFRGATPTRIRADARLCITSSDRGVLRKIYAKAGAQCEVGEFLAVLTTDEKEQFDEPSPTAKQAGLFRVVANLL